MYERSPVEFYTFSKKKIKIKKRVGVLLTIRKQILSAICVFPAFKHFLKSPSAIVTHNGTSWTGVQDSRTAKQS